MLLVNVWICLMIMISQQEPSLKYIWLCPEDERTTGRGKGGGWKQTPHWQKHQNFTSISFALKGKRNASLRCRLLAHLCFLQLGTVRWYFCQSRWGASWHVYERVEEARTYLTNHRFFFLRGSKRNSMLQTRTKKKLDRTGPVIWGEHQHAREGTV